MPAIINPELNKRALLDKFIILLYFKNIVITKMVIATTQNGIATLVKNNNGIPATAKPRNVRKATKVKHALWQI